MKPPRWAQCIYHLPSHTEQFLEDYLADERRVVLLVGAAGFDPRSTTVAELVSRLAGGRVRGFFLREERPNPARELIARGDSHAAELQRLIPGCAIERLEIFGSPNAVVGSRAAPKTVAKASLDGITDILVDLSALSIGVGFPIVSFLLGAAERLGLNLHLLVVDEPMTDGLVQPTANDVADTVHGFSGGWGSDRYSKSVKLWMPQLARGKRPMLECVRKRVVPHAVCPILPFPATRPRRPDELIEHYEAEFRGPWEVDARDLVYASEGEPLDLYRTVLRMDDARRRVFAEVGGSQIVLSPVGSKALAIGALMAALDREFTIMYVESLGFTVDLPGLDALRANQPMQLVHVWLHGEAYPPISPSVTESRA